MTESPALFVTHRLVPSKAMPMTPATIHSTPIARYIQRCLAMLAEPISWNTPMAMKKPLASKAMATRLTTGSLITAKPNSTARMPPARYHAHIFSSFGARASPAAISSAVSA